jgi:hypothetical protein
VGIRAMLSMGGFVVEIWKWGVWQSTLSTTRIAVRFPDCSTESNERGSRMGGECTNGRFPSHRVFRVEVASSSKLLYTE